VVMNVGRWGEVCWLWERKVGDARVSKRYFRGVDHLEGTLYIL